jgi:hypothetical protein
MGDLDQTFGTSLTVMIYQESYNANRERLRISYGATLLLVTISDSCLHHSVVEKSQLCLGRMNRQQQRLLSSLSISLN